MLRISVVIACFNGAETLDEALESLTAQEADVDWEIVLSDNGSTDASRAIFEAHARAHPQVAMRVVDASQRCGKSHALNVAIRRSEAEHLLFLDADDAVAPGWLAIMADALDRHPFVCARLGYRHFNEPDVAATRQLARQGVQTKPMELSHYPFCEFNGGATLGFHRAVFDSVGGFDEDMMALEDIDFCIRVFLQGYRLVFVPEATYHYRLRTEPEAIKQQMRTYAHTLVLLRKRYDPNIGSGLSIRWVRPAMAVVRLSLQDIVARLIGATGARRRIAANLGRSLGVIEGGLAYGVVPDSRRRRRCGAATATTTAMQR